MFSKSSQRLTFAKHVHLRTQQRRLRHVKSVVVRNLSPQLDLGDPLNFQTHFTVHPLYDVHLVLYRSEVISQTCNPSWESVQFTATTFGKHSSLSLFTIKIWVRPSGGDGRVTSPAHSAGGLSPKRGAGSGEELEKDSKLVFERTLDLSDLVYLGTLMNKDGSSYSTNSLAIGMFEGYYSDPEMGGVQAAMPIAHSLVDLLPPCSLLEVPRTEVQESYLCHTLQRMLSRQEVLNNAIEGGNRSKARVQEYMREQEDYFRKRKERENRKMRIALLQREIQQREKVEKEESKRLSKQKEDLDSFESRLRDWQAELRKEMTQHQLNILSHSQRLESLVCARKSQTLRQRNMVYELSQTFFIKEVRDTKEAFTICNVILPNSDQLDQTSNMEHFGVALGFAAHLVSHLSKILLVPLQYPVKPNSSRSTISDHISEEAIIDTIKEFPLYLKGSEKALFLYAVHLLNKDIGQIRQHCGYGGSRSMQKKTLPNLKYLLDELIKDFFVMTQQPYQQPIRTTPAATPTTPGYSKPIDAYFNSIAENGRHMSSRGSSFATTTGLSLTPPIPSVDHEAFHSMALPAGVGVARQPIANGAEDGARRNVGGAKSVVGVAMEVGGAEEGVPTQNGGLGEDGFNVGLFRSRSNHVTGDYPMERGVRRGSSEGSTSHEQLHYGASVEAESGGDLSARIENGTKEQGLTPPSFPNEQLERYIQEQNTANQQQQQQQQQEQQHQHGGNRHDLIHFEQSNGAVRETSPAGAGLFGPSSECASEEPVGMAGEVGGDTPVLGRSVQESDGLGNEGVESWKEWNMEDRRDSSSNRNLNRIADQELHSSVAPSRRGGPSEGVSLESSLDFPVVKRSSKLVSAGVIQSRRERAESKEHNMPPSPLDPTEEFPSGSIFFTASGFSRLSPSESEIRASTPTGYADHGDNHVPQVFVERPFSPPERDGSSIAAGDFVNSSDWSSGGLECSNDVSRNSRTHTDERSPPPLTSQVAAPVVGESDSEPMLPLLNRGKAREVELVDINTLPLSEPSLYSKGELQTAETNSVLPGASTPPNNHFPLSSEGLPSDSSPPSDSSHPRAELSYTAFPRSPQLYKSSLATPHVLGGHQEVESAPAPHRVRANSNRLQNPLAKVRGHNHYPATTSGGGRSRSHSEEESTEFLEDFIDGL